MAGAGRLGVRVKAAGGSLPLIVMGPRAITGYRAVGLALAYRLGRKRHGDPEDTYHDVRHATTRVVQLTGLVRQKRLG